MDPHRLVEAEKAQAAGQSPAQEPQEVAKEHKVDKLVGFRQSSSGKREYKVRWEGYGPTDDTWEPVAHLSGVLDLVERYDAALKERAEQSKAKAAAAAGPGTSATEQEVRRRPPSLLTSRCFAQTRIGTVLLTGRCAGGSG